MRRLLPCVLLLLAPAAALGAEVQVFAAASLTRAFTAAQAELKPSLTLELNLAGSQQLALQIAQGARADVFASADERWIRQVEKDGLLVGPPRLFARNRLVVLLPSANPGHIDTLADLARPGIKLVLAADAVPAGRYARQALGNLAKRPDLGADYAKRVLANLVSEEENVQAVAAKVRLGEADAGIVYVTDVGDDVSAWRTIEIPAEANVVVEYYIGIVKNGPNPVSAPTFVKWLISPPGQALLEKHGFLPAKE